MNRLRTLFFPSGQVHTKYTSYIGWSFASNVLVSAESAMATHSMLHSISCDTETIRTLNYIGKDVIGQLGCLAYIAKTGKEVDKDPKRFLFYSNFAQQLAYMSVCATPMSPEYFLPIAGFSNIFSNVSFIGFGAINAKCIQKLAIDGNVGELYAKISVFNTIGSSLGLMIGLGIVTVIPDHSTRLCLIPIFAFCRIAAFNRAVNGLI